ncbi:preprotein translocase subunit SecE [Candidatus Saccharibacteria bacterium]|nr:preprotein translocase subunit SecE [Candidatus Saccharibacteria bacterium]
MAKKVTRIKASDSPKKVSEEEKPTLKKKVVAKDKKDEKKQAEKVREAVKAEKQAEKKADKAKEEKNGKKTFILFRPFVAFGRYIRDAFREIRQVRWPNRKDTWKMVLAVFVYTILFIVLITLLDLFFTWLFKLILGN